MEHYFITTIYAKPFTKFTNFVPIRHDDLDAICFWLADTWKAFSSETAWPERPMLYSIYTMPFIKFAYLSRSVLNMTAMDNSYSDYLKDNISSPKPIGQMEQYLIQKQ